LCSNSPSFDNTDAFSPVPPMSNERVRGSPRPRGLLSDVVVPAEALVGALLVAGLVRRLLARALRLGLVVALPDTRLRPLLGAADFPADPELARALAPGACAFDAWGEAGRDPAAAGPAARDPAARDPAARDPAARDPADLGPEAGTPGASDLGDRVAMAATILAFRLSVVDRAGGISAP
jgi:hypothetical protein